MPANDQRTPCRRILVVDDNVDSADSITTLLNLTGHQAKMAFNAAQALSVCREFRPEIVILDLLMPETDGIELTRQIRAEPDFGAPVIIALSGMAADEYRSRAFEAGVDHFILKPGEVDRLSDGNLFQRRQEAGSAR